MGKLPFPPSLNLPLMGAAAGGPLAAAGAGRGQAELAAPSPSSSYGPSLSL